MKKNKSWFRFTVRDRLVARGQTPIYFIIREDATITGMNYIAMVITVDSKERLFRYSAFSSDGNVYINKDRCIGSVIGGRRNV